MAGVVRKFFIASMFMWIAPIAILYGFNHDIFPGINTLDFEPDGEVRKGLFDTLYRMCPDKQDWKILHKELERFQRAEELFGHPMAIENRVSKQPGSSQLSSYSKTLVSGLIAVISVNAVIAFYIWMAMKEPSDRHEPDPAFLAEAKASIRQDAASATASEGSSESRDKQE